VTRAAASLPHIRQPAIVVLDSAPTQRLPKEAGKHS